MNFSFEINELSVYYSSESVIANINLSVKAGEWIAILGKSGAGKTSFLRALGGLLPSNEKSTGTITNIQGKPFSTQTTYLSQSDSLVPWLTVLENVCIHLKLHSYQKNKYQEQVDQAHVLLKKVGLEKKENAYPHQLSGGMRQRAGLVRTLLQNKPIILLDEPFSSLDAITRFELQSLIVDLLVEKTVLFVTHDPTEALRLATRIVILKKSPAPLEEITIPTSNLPRDINEIYVSHAYKAILKSLSIGAL